MEDVGGGGRWTYVALPEWEALVGRGLWAGAAESGVWAGQLCTAIRIPRLTWSPGPLTVGTLGTPWDHLPSIQMPQSGQRGLVSSDTSGPFLSLPRFCAALAGAGLIWRVAPG